MDLINQVLSKQQISWLYRGQARKMIEQEITQKQFNRQILLQAIRHHSNYIQLSDSRFIYDFQISQQHFKQIFNKGVHIIGSIILILRWKIKIIQNKIKLCIQKCSYVQGKGIKPTNLEKIYKFSLKSQEQYLQRKKLNLLTQKTATPKQQHNLFVFLDYKQPRTFQQPWIRLTRQTVHQLQFLNHNKKVVIIQ